MAALVKTLTKPTGVQDTVFGNKRIKIRDLTIDTGDYAADGFTISASELNLNRIDFVSVGSVATTGTDGATASAIGIEYLSRTSIRVHLYESGAQNAPLAEKTAEAVAANFTVRLFAVGS